MVHVVIIISLFFMMPELNKRYPFRIFSFIILFLFMALRYNYGNDYMGYYEMHTWMNLGLSTHAGNDVLFRFLNIYISNFYVLIALISLFYLVSVTFLINRNLKSTQYLFAFLLLLVNPYLFLVHLSALRQTLALCFFIFAVNFAVKRKLILYIIFVLIAAGLHSSAILLLPLYPLLNEKKIKDKHILGMILLLLVFTLTPIFDIFILKLLSYLPYYFRYYYEQGLQNSLRSTIISSFFMIFIAINFQKLRGREIIYGKLSLVASFLSILTFKLALISRVGMYFDIFYIVTIPQLFIRIESKIHRYLLFVIFTAIYLLRYYSFFINPLWESFIEYKSIFGK